MPRNGDQKVETFNGLQTHNYLYAQQLDGYYSSFPNRQQDSAETEHYPWNAGQHFVRTCVKYCTDPFCALGSWNDGQTVFFSPRNVSVSGSAWPFWFIMTWIFV
jgi:hypothetical protein